MINNDTVLSYKHKFGIKSLYFDLYLYLIFLFLNLFLFWDQLLLPLKAYKKMIFYFNICFLQVTCNSIEY